MPDFQLPSNVAKQGDAADLLQAGLVSPPAPAAAPVQGTPSQAPAKSEPAVNEDWQHKYKVLQGKYDREMPELRNVIKQQGDVIQTLQDALEKSAAAPPPPAGPPPGKPQAVVLDPAEFETYGDKIVSLVEMVNGLVAENARLRTAQPNADAPVSPEVIQRIERVEKSADERFYSDLETACPGWRELNTDDEFLNWAHTPDALLGVKPFATLRRGYDARNVDQVAKIFNEFIRLFRKNAPQNPPRIQVPSGQGGSPPSPNAGAPDMAALLEKMRQGQRDFIARRIDEAKYNEIVAEYQTALKQTRQGQ